MTAARSTLVTAIETIVDTLHKNAEFDCDASLEDSVEDHDFEMAIAGQIITDLRAHGLTIAKRRSDAGKPKRRR